MASTIKHYPTATTTTYHIGQYHIDDVFRVDFTRKVTDQPIWGYASKQYDFIASGREIITGNIVINFRYPGYLTNVLEVIRSNDTAANRRMTDSKLIEDDPNADHSQRIADILQTYDDLSSSEHKMQVISDILEGNRQKSPVDPDLLANGPNVGDFTAAADDLKRNLKKRFLNQFESNASDVDIKALNSPIGDVGSIPFDMHAQYGFQGMSGHWRRVFKDVILIGESQTVQAVGVHMGQGLGEMASSAQSLLEIYPFFARGMEVVRYV